jgi:hypothetical protein
MMPPQGFASPRGTLTAKRRRPMSVLGTMMLRAGLLSEGQVDAVNEQAASRSTSHVDAILELGLADEDTLVAFISSKLMVPRVRPSVLERVDQHTLARLPGVVAWDFKCMPVSADELGNLTVAMADPTDMRGVDKVAELTGAYLVRAVATVSDIQRALERHYGPEYAVRERAARVGSGPTRESSRSTELDLQPIRGDQPPPSLAPVGSTPPPGTTPGMASTVVSVAAPTVAAPPVVAPIAPPIVAPVVPPIAAPVVPPIAAPVAPPVAPPVAAPPVAPHVAATPPVTPITPPSPPVAAPSPAPYVSGIGIPDDDDDIPVRSSHAAEEVNSGEHEQARDETPEPPPPPRPVAAPYMTPPRGLTPSWTEPPPTTTAPIEAPVHELVDVQHRGGDAGRGPRRARAHTPWNPPLAGVVLPPEPEPPAAPEPEPEPLSPEAFARILPRLEVASDRDEVTTLLMDFLGAGFDRVILFVHSHNELRGLDARGKDLLVEAVRQVRIPTTGASSFADAIQRGTPYFGPAPASTKIDQAFSQALGGVRGNVLLLPITLGNKVPLLLWAHGTAHPLDPRSIHELSAAVSTSILRIIAAAKRKG